MFKDFTRYILKTIEDKGFKAYVVGGYVRDYIMNIKSSDIDIATSATPDQILNLFKDEKCLTHGIDFGTVVLVRGGEEIEVTTFRSEGEYKDFRRPSEVLFSKELKDDINRRDFTINALAMDLRGKVYDYVGGERDIEDKILRSVGDPHERIREDALRILRAVRFSSKYDLSIEEDLKQAIRENVELLKFLSPERIYEELSKMLMYEKPSKSFYKMAELDILEVILPELCPMIGFNQHTPYHDKSLFDHTMWVLDRVDEDLSLRLAALYHDAGKLSTMTLEGDVAHFYGHEKVSAEIFESRMKKLHSPNYIIDRGRIFIENHMKANERMLDPALRRQIRKVGKENIDGLYSLLIADRVSTTFGRDAEFLYERRKRVTELLNEPVVSEKSFLNINGNDLMDLGFKEGKVLGKVLNELKEMVIENPELNDKNKLIEIVKEKFMRKYFGTDGIRGVAGSELSPELAYKVGRSMAKVIGKKGDSVLIGKDTRYSGDMLEAALMSGIMSMGMDVVQLGICPTPCVAYLVRETGARAGVVISASHNPFEYNGIKIFSGDGFKLDDSVELEIEGYIEVGVEDIHTGDELGRVLKSKESVKLYEDYLKSLVTSDIKGLKVGLDLGNGALYKMAEEILSSLGAEVHVINDTPDGTNINKSCGSTNTDLIMDLVKRENLDLGFAFDGDADRIIAVDEKGEIVDGDHLLAIFAQDLKAKGELKNDGVVGTIMSNIGLEKFLNEIGAKSIKAQVGDRYVLEEMRKGGYVLGGEQSGHIVFLQNNTTGDGLATGLHLLNILAETGKKLSELNRIMTTYPQVLINAKVPNEMKKKILENEVIKSEIEKTEKILEGEGRVVIRPSGTEPVVRVMVEGKDKEELTALVKNLVEIIERECGK